MSGKLAGVIHQRRLVGQCARPVVSTVLSGRALVEHHLGLDGQLEVENIVVEDLPDSQVELFSALLQSYS